MRDDITSRAYREFNANKAKDITMLLHQERIVTEKNELDEKIDKLSVFIKGNFYRELPGDEQARLNDQFSAMNDYSNILRQRIAAFPA